MKHNKLAEATINGKVYWLIQGDHSQGCHACVFDEKPECDSSVTNACMGKNWAYFKEAPQTTGEKVMNNVNTGINKPHKHAEAIKAWADGALIEYHDAHDTVWRAVSEPSWDTDRFYRVKPEKEFPETTLNVEELFAIYDEGTVSCRQSCLDVANAAIKHFIESGEMDKYIEANK